MCANSEDTNICTHVIIYKYSTRCARLGGLGHGLGWYVQLLAWSARNNRYVSALVLVRQTGSKNAYQNARRRDDLPTNVTSRERTHELNVENGSFELYCYA